MNERKVLVSARALDALLAYVKDEAKAGNDLASQALETWDELRGKGPVEQ